MPGSMSRKSLAKPTESYTNAINWPVNLRSRLRLGLTPLNNNIDLGITFTDGGNITVEEQHCHSPAAASSDSMERSSQDNTLKRNQTLVNIQNFRLG